MFIKLIKDSNKDMNKAEIICLCLSPIIGVLLTRLLLFTLVKPTHTSFGQKLTTIFFVWTTDNLESLLDTQCKEQDRFLKQSKVISEVYRHLMLLAAMMVCLGHGSNDVANSISPLLMVIDTKFEAQSIKYAYVIGSVGISLGLLILGKKVMKTVGKSVIKLDFAKGFTA